MPYDCFISYQSSDIAHAEKVFAGLQAAGIAAERIWFDRRRLQPGFEWHKEIETGCETSRVILPVLTPRWQASEWTRFETYGAEAVIPLRFDGRFEDVTPPPLRRFQAQEISFTEGDAANVWQRLAAALNELIARPAPEKFERVVHLRYQSNPNFVGRERELLEIHQQLHENPTTTLKQGRPQVIAAMGGIGKTTLARQYAEKFWRCYVEILWVDARNPGGLEAEYANLFDMLHPTADPQLKQAEKAQRMLRRLSGREERLLIVDNAEDEAAVRHWMPNAGGCRTLITSRFSGWSAGFGVTPLYELNEESARSLLLARSEIGNPAADELQACDQLAQRLGYLPLALEQAAAYIRKQRMSFKRYLDLYGQQAATLLRKGALGSTEYPDAVMTTWNATIDKLPAVSRALLRLVAFMAPMPIPLEFCIANAGILRHTTAVLIEHEYAGREQEPLPQDDEIAVRDALEFLAEYSMVRIEADHFTVHALVQTVEQSSLDAEHFGFWALGAGTFVDGCPDDPTDPEHWPLLRKVWLHLDYAASSELTAIKKLQTTSQQIDLGDLPANLLQVLTYLGKLQTALGSYPLAEKYLRFTVDNDAHLPPNARRTLHPLAALSNLLAETDRPAEAAELRRRELTLYETTLGADHPDVSVPLTRLAQVLAKTGLQKEAESCLHRSLKLLEAHTDEPALDNKRAALIALADLCRDAGREAEAEDLYAQYREIVTRLAHASKDESIFVEGWRVTDAANCARQGEPDKAERLLEAFLAANIDGKPDDTAAAALENTAIVYGNMDRYDKVIPLLIRAIELKQEIYQGAHREVAEPLMALANAYEQQREYGQAIKFWGLALKMLQQLFPQGHSLIVKCLHGTAATHLAFEHPGDAVEPLNTAIHMLERSATPDRQQIGECCAMLGSALSATNQLAAAQPVMARALEVFEQHYGRGAEKVTDLLRDWAGDLIRAGRLDDAELLIRRRLVLMEAREGNDSPLLQGDLRMLADSLREQNRWPECEAVLRRGMGIAEAHCDSSLVEWQMLLGTYLRHTDRCGEAVPLFRAAVAVFDTQPESQEQLMVANAQLAESLAGENEWVEAEKIAATALRMSLVLSARNHKEHDWLATAVRAWIAAGVHSGAGPTLAAELQALFAEAGLQELLPEVVAKLSTE